MTGRNRAAQLEIVKQMSRPESRSSAGPDHVTEHALFTWMITHLSRDWSCTDHVPIRRHHNFFLCSPLIKLPLCFQYGHLLTFLLSPLLRDLVPGGKTRNILIWTKVWGSSYFNLNQVVYQTWFPWKTLSQGGGWGNLCQECPGTCEAREKPIWTGTEAPAVTACP